MSESDKQRELEEAYALGINGHLRTPPQKVLMVFSRHGRMWQYRYPNPDEEDIVESIKSCDDQYALYYNTDRIKNKETLLRLVLEDKYSFEHRKLKESGMFWEFYPELSGEWEKDKDSFIEQLEFTRNNGA